MTTFSQFLVDEHDFETICDLWNDYCQEEGDLSDLIYHSIDELEELFSSPSEMARAVFFGNVENWHDKVFINAYGNIYSAWCIEHSPIDISSLADWLEEIMHPSYALFLEEYAVEEDE